jgi:hypothetical protein
MTRDDHEGTDPELAELALELRERERDQEEDDDSLFPESFMHEFTDFKTWDEFKVRLAATPRPERESFVSSTTRFASFEEMERAALERLDELLWGD